MCRSTGIDAYRMAANSGVCGPLLPAKRFVRSETVDQQAGELECSRGNIYYPGFRRRMEVLKCTPVERPADIACRVIDNVKAILAPDRRQVVADIGARQSADGTITLYGSTSEPAVFAAVADSLRSRGMSYTNNVEVYAHTFWAFPPIFLACMWTPPPPPAGNRALWSQHPSSCGPIRRRKLPACAMP